MSHAFTNTRTSRPSSPQVTEYYMVEREAHGERRSLPAGPGLGSSPGTATSWALPGTGASLGLAHAYQIYI